MRAVVSFLARTAPALFLLLALPAWGASADPKPAPKPCKSKIVGAGETLNLTANFVLSDADILELNGTKEKPCTLKGNGFQIKTKDSWCGKLKLSYCRVYKLGAAPAVKSADELGPDVPGLDLDADESASIEIGDCSFSQCGTLDLKTDGSSTVAFTHNRLLDDSLVPAAAAAYLSRPAFRATGGSWGSKKFQGNAVLKSYVEIDAPAWQIGGDGELEGNVVIGLRAGIHISGGGTRVAGNFVEPLMPGPDEGPKIPYWSQVATLTAGKDTTVERNVFRGGHWPCHEVLGEFRKNLVLDMAGHEWMRTGTGRVHHNIFAGGEGLAGIEITGPDAEIYNNTFDGGGGEFPAVSVTSGGFVKTLRNNVFFDFAGPAVVAPAFNEKIAPSGPARLGYANYNFFGGGRTPGCDYALSVAGKSAHKDAGFGLNDVPRAKNNPKFTGSPPEKFPFSEAAIKSGSVTVSKILDFYTKAYTPAADSPLAGAGDPADGAKTDIGAVEAAKK